MCGITGVIDSSNRSSTAMIVPMTAALRHRGPDDEGYLLVDSRTRRLIQCGGPDSMTELALVPRAKQGGQKFDLALGHRRLLILDLSAAGHCPMSSADGQAWITYNGEVYNYVELGSELEALGYRFRSGSDTEVVVNAYVEWGPDCLRRFNGMWAFAIWDLRKRRLFCARDRFGIKPFHYYWDGQLFAFASEIKALLAHPDIPRRPNDAIIYDYLALGSLDHTNETFFEGIKRLPPSHCLLFDLDRNRLRIQRWWDVEVNPALDDDCLTDDRQLAQFRDLLTDAVRLRLRSDVPIGTCLSGGLDSSSIVCLANRLMLEEGALPRELVGERQKTFSACFDDPAIDERPYIQQVIEHTGAESNQVFPRGGEDGLWHDLKRLAWHQEEPFGSTSVYSQWNIMRLAKQRGVTVLLDGQGGDELLAGYHHYLGPFLAQTVRAQGPWTTLQTVQAVSAATGQSTALLLGLGLYNSLPRVTQRVILNLGNARFRTNPTVSESMLQPSFRRQFAKRRLVHGKHLGYHNLAERLYQDVFVHSLPALLRYEDRNSMAFSLEARVPFLDYRLVEFCFSLPVTQRIRDGWTKWVLRQAMDDILPERVRWRRSKLGFATPERRWLQEGAGWIRRLFNQGEVLSEPYLHRQAIQRLRNWPGNGLINIPGLWRMVNLEVWLRAFWEERIVE